MLSWPAIAAANNAEWCAVVCWTHAIETRFDGDVWTSRTRTPPRYPDAVTLVPGLSIRELLARIDARPGCSVKDSFASLDLRAYGFRVLFAAQWILRLASAGGGRGSSSWNLIRDAEAFTRWEEAWRGDDGPSGVLRGDLLRHPAVRVLAEQIDNRVVAGAVLSGGAEVVGISNFFGDVRTASASWEGCVAYASSLFPGATLVAYASGDALDVARASGFEVVGPLRVWVLDA